MVVVAGARGDTTSPEYNSMLLMSGIVMRSCAGVANTTPRRPHAATTMMSDNKTNTDAARVVEYTKKNEEALAEEFVRKT